MSISTPKNDKKDKACKVLRGPNIAFTEELDATAFTIFEPISDLGFFSWNPNKKLRDKKMSDIKTEKEIDDQIDLRLNPPDLVNVRSLAKKLPMNFQDHENLTHWNKYPYQMPHIVPLYIASCYHDIEINDVDFIFGGSALDMFAQKSIDMDEKFIGFSLPHTKALVVAKHKVYLQDYSAPGFQFERFVTGSSFTDTHGLNSHEHLHLMKVGQNTVLFCGEVDAQDNGVPVEVTASNPHYWGTKKVFQNISNGSASMCIGRKYHGSLVSISTKSLSDLARDALIYPNSVTKMEDNICSGMEVLKDEARQFETGEAFEISFRGNEMVLKPFHGLDKLSDNVTSMILTFGKN